MAILDSRRVKIPVQRFAEKIIKRLKDILKWIIETMTVRDLRSVTGLSHLIPKKIKIRESQRPDQDILSLAVRGSPMIVCFGTHQIKFKKPSNDSLSRSDFTKSLKINEIESDDEKDSDEDEDGESGSGSDSGGMVAKLLHIIVPVMLLYAPEPVAPRRTAAEKIKIQGPHRTRRNKPQKSRTERSADQAVRGSLGHSMVHIILIIMAGPYYTIE